MSMNRATIVGLTASTALTLLGPSRALGQSAGELFSDTEVSVAIQTDLIADDAVSEPFIDVSTEDGIVELSGRVDNILARDRAVACAKATKGVRSVVDRITIDAPTRPDDEIEHDVLAALRTDPATDAYELDVEVTNGIVTLTSTVDSWQEKRLATIVAKGVRGVKGVQNDLLVHYADDRNDYEIQADVERRLATSIWADTRFLDVQVQDGVVSLSGVVGSEAARNRAHQLAWVAGVKSVSDEDLRTDWWARHRMRRAQINPVPDDPEIADAVEEALAYDPRVRAFNIDVAVRHGAATLTGRVDNLKARAAAAADAKNTIGVWRVRNRIGVRPTAVPDDMAIAHAVRDTLERDPYVNRYEMDVSVDHGTVTLSGELNTSFEVERARDLASRVNGVIAIENDLDYDHRWTWRPDREIRDDVESQLYWSPFVDSEDITVSVESGVVTLTGVVSDWYEWRMATENAFEADVRDVRNQLELVSD